MKYILILLLVLLTGCTDNINSRQLSAGEFLCSDQGGISSIEIYTVGDALYICNDGSHFVVVHGSGGSGGEKYYFIKHNSFDKGANEKVDRILLPEKWKRKDGDNK